MDTREQMQDEQAALEATPAPEPILAQEKGIVEKAVRTRKKVGKSADKKHYIQVSGYVKKQTLLAAKNKLNKERMTAGIDDAKRDFSDLLDDLLTEWVKK